jgi:hypothetical protein
MKAIKIKTYVAPFNQEQSNCSAGEAVAFPRNVLRECLTPSIFVAQSKYSMAWVRERTILTERPPLVGDVSSNFYGWRVSRTHLG